MRFKEIVTVVTEKVKDFLKNQKRQIIKDNTKFLKKAQRKIYFNLRKPRIFFMPTLNIGCVFYRMENFINEMRRQGYEIAYRYHPPEYYGTCVWEHRVDEKLMNEIENIMKIADIAIFQPVHTPQALALVQGIMQTTGKKVLAEYDDDIFAVSAENISYRATHPGGTAEWFNKEQLRLSDGVIVSTPYLKKRYDALNKNIFVIPNAIDFNVWNNVKRGREHKRIRIGWIGGASHGGDLRLVKKPILEILRRYKNVEFWVHTGGLPDDWMVDVPRLHAFHRWFPIDKYAEGLAKYNFDIGIAPLKDTQFNRAKSNLRFLEFGALKIPTVCSQTESYVHDVEHWHNGFLAREENEWFYWLKVLIENEGLRKEIGMRAYRYVKKKYNVCEIAKKYAKILGKFL